MKVLNAKRAHAMLKFGFLIITDVSYNCNKNNYKNNNNNECKQSKFACVRKGEEGYRDRNCTA